ncbi:hypothetical protein NDU88_005969 [Pleurodeles waltl]|uniref:Uncharacterized protein n=1 Tax=Pleurodeles waltl TaxID=8319 RepID=A0AAV7MEG2_PLEWA|nr:hypothetical protein NDU88_005969 [Pleurodeles waltl]
MAKVFLSVFKKFTLHHFTIKRERNASHHLHHLRRWEAELWSSPPLAAGVAAAGDTGEAAEATEVGATSTQRELKGCEAVRAPARGSPLERGFQALSYIGYIGRPALFFAGATASGDCSIYRVACQPVLQQWLGGGGSFVGISACLPLHCLACLWFLWAAVAGSRLLDSWIPGLLGLVGSCKSSWARGAMQGHRWVSHSTSQWTALLVAAREDSGPEPGPTLTFLGLLRTACVGAT